MGADCNARLFHHARMLPLRRRLASVPSAGTIAADGLSCLNQLGDNPDGSVTRVGQAPAA